MNQNRGNSGDLKTTLENEAKRVPYKSESMVLLERIIDTEFQNKIARYKLSGNGLQSIENEKEMIQRLLTEVEKNLEQLPKDCRKLNGNYIYLRSAINEAFGRTLVELLKMVLRAEVLAATL